MINLCNSRDLDSYLRKRMRFDVEEVWALALNARLDLIAADMIFRGHATSCPVHPREIFRFAILHGAVHLALAHSHPSGDHRASKEDLKLTRELHEIARWIRIPLVDHLVLSEKGFFSMSDAGYLRRWQKKKERFY